MKKALIILCLFTCLHGDIFANRPNSIIMNYPYDNVYDNSLSDSVIWDTIVSGRVAKVFIPITKQNEDKFKNTSTHEFDHYGYAEKNRVHIDSLRARILALFSKEEQQRFSKTGIENRVMIQTDIITDGSVYKVCYFIPLHCKDIFTDEIIKRMEVLIRNTLFFPPREFDYNYINIYWSISNAGQETE